DRQTDRQTTKNIGIVFGVCSMLLFGCLGNVENLHTSSSQRMSNGELVEILCDGEYVTEVKEETIIIPGLKQEYKFLYISDLHIIIPNEEVSQMYVETVQQRFNEMAINQNGYKAWEIYDKLIESINKTDIDGVLMGGDMLDYLSCANWSHMEQGLVSLTVPYLFATADHDTQPYYTDYIGEAKIQLQNSISQGLVDTLEYDEFIILSINESTSNLNELVLGEIEKVFEIGKPVILVIHVPLNSSVDNGLAKTSENCWGGRKLLLGEGCTYYNEQVGKLLQMINASDTPVVAVLGGHLHFEYICMLNQNVKQYIFEPAYTGEVQLFTIKGE
ncbi:MAG: metallophosphoesterase, partial [Agathobacter sp.]|nr:metallophosphoesterase [Agathobacter sp.]